MPEDGDLTPIEDALESAFETSITVADVLDQRLCPEHHSLMTRSSQMETKTFPSLITRMKAFRGEDVSCFIVDLLHAYGLSKVDDIPASVSPFPIPNPTNGIVWFSKLYDVFSRRCKEKEPGASVLDRRTMRGILVSALAPFGVETHRDSRNGFIYFFREELVVASARQLGPTASGSASKRGARVPAFVRPLESTVERAELVRLGKLFAAKKTEMLQGSFQFRHFVMAISPWYWTYQYWTLSSERQREGCMREAANSEVPDALHVWPCGLAAVSLPDGDLLHLFFCPEKNWCVGSVCK